MKSLGELGPFIRQCVQSALGCLDAMLSEKPYEPNDLIAGPLGLDQLAKLAPDATQATTVALELRLLARNCRFVLRTAEGRSSAEYLERSLSAIARLIAEADEDLPGQSGDGGKAGEQT